MTEAFQPTVKHPAQGPEAQGPEAPVPRTAGGSPTEFEVGFLLGILAGEGHFGGDGRQPEVTLRMHTRHERLFRARFEQSPLAQGLLDLQGRFIAVNEACCALVGLPMDKLVGSST